LKHLSYTSASVHLLWYLEIICDVDLKCVRKQVYATIQSFNALTNVGYIRHILTLL